jgi:hypothetical protein
LVPPLGACLKFFQASKACLSHPNTNQTEKVFASELPVFMSAESRGRDKWRIYIPPGGIRPHQHLPSPGGRGWGRGKSTLSDLSNSVSPPAQPVVCPWVNEQKKPLTPLSLGASRRTRFWEAVGKCSDARHPSLYKPQALILRNEAYLPVRRSDEE